MKRGQALAESADLFRRFHPWSDDADKCDAWEKPALRKSPKALDRMNACAIGVRITIPGFGETRRIEATGETWEDAVETLRRKLRHDRIAFNGALPWLFAMMDAAADGTLNMNAARQFRAWVDHEENES